MRTEQKRIAWSKPMFYSTSCEYALRALTHLAANESPAPIQVKEIAEAEEIPRHFLAKILNQLTYKNLVRAMRGPGGGFLLSRPATEILVGEVVDAIDGVESIRNRCVLGLNSCKCEVPCPMHDDWERVREDFLGSVNRLSLAAMAKNLADKRLQKDSTAADAA
jgi:Rrf2 family iron-sulfur cluster assembly transcriptional regulator